MNEKITSIAIEWQSADIPRRKELIREIVRTGSGDGLKLLAQVFNRDPDIQIRQSARKAYNALYKYCQRTQAVQEQPRREAATSEGYSDEALIEMLSSGDPDQEVKCLMYCQKYQNQAVLNYLREHYSYFHDNKTKATLVKTIGMGQTPSDVPIIYKYLEDENARVRANAIEALEYINHPNTYMIFVQWLGDSDNRVKANCIKALQRLGKDSVNRILEDMLYSEYVAYKESALYVLSLYPSKPGLELLKGFLTREYDPALLERAVYIIYDFAQQNIPGAQEFLDEYYSEHDSSGLEEEALDVYVFDERDLQSDDTEVLIRALTKVLENQYVKYAGRLVDLLLTKEDDLKVVSYVLRILGELKCREYIAQIAPFLKASDDRVRANAVEALGRIGRNLDILVPFLKDPNNRVRANAMVALKDGDYVDVIPAVYDMIAHEDPIFRRSSIYAIKQLKDERALDALEHLAQDADETVKSQAIEALQFYEICGITGATQVLVNIGASLYEEYNEYEYEDWYE
jgi:HEAT repeat protein